MGRGHKTCPQCKTQTGPRALKCKNCSHVFIFKADKDEAPKTGRVSLETKLTGIEKVTDFDWKQLVRGDRIKVVQGSGPYFPVENSDPIPMGYAGKFTVLYIMKDGIHAYGNPKEGEGARCFIWMGEEGLSKHGVYRVPHKIIKLKPRKERV